MDIEKMMIDFFRIPGIENNEKTTETDGKGII